MAITFDTITGGTSTNSYTTVTEFNSYVEKLAYTDDMPASDQTTLIQKLLIAATESVDVELRFNSIGSTASSTQRLEYPRSGTYNRRALSIANNVIPQELKEAVCEMALWLYMNEKNNAQSDGSDDPSEVSIGGAMSFTYDVGRSTAIMVPTRVKYLLSYIGFAYVPKLKKRVV